MSSESADRKKGNASEIAPEPNGDHRKRRRNRTTQSCLNCHTSKRMCDRKRPACARCTQLGLTGLCVYEVDDPTQRTETQDESSRLIKKVAELEGVIRELKNKPHPRWAQASNSGEKCHTRLHPPVGGEREMCPSNAPSLPDSSSSSEKGCSHPSLTCVPTYAKADAGIFPATIDFQAHTGCPHPDSHYYQGSDLGTPSPPSLLTPTDEYPLTQVGVADIGSLTLPQDYDFGSMFLTYPSTMGYADNSLRSGVFDKEHGSHCGCLREQSNYHVMLELSLRLRKASDFLSRSPIHRLGGFHSCLIHQTISNLDNFMTNALSDITATVGNLPELLISTEQFPSESTDKFLSRPTSCPKQPIHNTQNYHLSPSAINNPLASVDDPFMSWEPPRHY
ncbi:hypothetical protein BYT27DRAFT_7339039 [Phlegmacium glaucopus]|nr:hypothetical protein BYT27DRAFT_7339039 [Phlegmacium glaucopus]